MALHLVLRNTKRGTRVLLATTNKAFAKTKFALESISLKDGALQLIEVKRVKVLDKVIARSNR